MRKALLIILALILLAGCTETDVQEPIKTIVCNPPYIHFEDKCCLDNNNNNICDMHEEQIVEIEEEQKEEVEEFLPSCWSRKEIGCIDIKSTEKNIWIELRNYKQEIIKVKRIEVEGCDLYEQRFTLGKGDTKRITIDGCNLKDGESYEKKITIIYSRLVGGNMILHYKIEDIPI